MRSRALRISPVSARIASRGQTNLTVTGGRVGTLDLDFSQELRASTGFGAFATLAPCRLPIP